MSRFRGHRAPPLEDVRLALYLGDWREEFAPQALELAWEAYRTEIMQGWHYPRVKAGFRPWAFWAFDLNEEEPEEWADCVLRLAELGLLQDSELRDLAEERTWTDSSDGSSHTDEEAVALYERVIERLKSPMSPSRTPGHRWDGHRYRGRASN